MPCLTCGRPNGGPGYCPAHQPTKPWTPKPSSTARGYDRQWRNLIATILATQPECHWCGQPATTGDHLLPLATHPELRLDPTNVVPACRRCNSRRGGQQRHAQ